MYNIARAGNKKYGVYLDFFYLSHILGVITDNLFQENMLQFLQEDISPLHHFIMI